MSISKLKLRSITARLSALSWMVTILTLMIFVTGIIPEQKRDLLDALNSKARGISSSLQEVTASAAISEDYSSVVDQCVQVLAGDEAIEYLVITKNDGFSVIVDRKGWRTEKLGEQWRPQARRPRSLIEGSGLTGRRVFSFGKPFEYSGIQWGWIHVGLSLQAYDRSVSSVYRRTGILAIFCVGMSLLASVTYAKRMVRPIRSLQAVVRRIAEGDLAARADIRSGGELGSLADSVNRMADSILKRNRILESVRFSAQNFLTETQWQAVIPGVLAKIGLAAGVSRAFVFRNQPDEGLATRCTECFEWSAPCVVSSRSNPQWSGFMWREQGIRLWAEELSGGRPVTLHVDELADASRVLFEPSVKSRILLPILVGNRWWGCLGFDDCEGRREWSDAERDTFQTAADMLGATIARQQVQDSLREANETLETKVTERTHELQEQVNAKERARAELSEAQQRLMEASRLTGMAEVATSVLHNVGNVLNSVNTSAGVVAAKMQEFRVGNLATIVSMFEEHSGDLDKFLRNDPKGQRVVPYLAKLSRHFQQERESILKELGLLTEHIGHIKSIVATQQKHAAVAGLVEQISLSELVEDAIRIVEAGFENYHIELVRDFENVPAIYADKHKILQILLNLLRNAKRATADSGKPDRVIRIRILRHSESTIRIEIRDNGVGLPAENLTRIFAHGFTTKRDGHGFGLHSSAIAARQMAGSLWAESEGPGLGATFTLELPLKTAPREMASNELARIS